MKAYKVELLVIDFDGLDADGVRDTIENVRYPNHCISPQVMALEDRDIGEWDDNNPLNRRDTANAEYRRLFGEAARSAIAAPAPSASSEAQPVSEQGLDAAIAKIIQMSASLGLEALLPKAREIIRAVSTQPAPSMPEEWKLTEKANCYQLARGNEVVALLSGPNAEANAAKIASMLGYELDGVIYDTEHNGFDEVCLNTVKRVRVALAAAPASTAAPVVPEWQSIKTAPKDGTEIIGWADDAGRVICRWGKHNHVPLYGWIRRIELYGEEVDGFDPALWMPLAAEPKPDA
jgi:hypothetical protein